MPPTTAIDYARLYQYRFRDVDQAARQRVWDEIARYVYGRMGEPQRVLDPAAGRCEFINAVPAGERWVVDAVDHGEFRDAAVHAIIADIQEAELPVDYFDGVFVSNFLEHLPTQEVVAAVLAKLREAMTVGGRIVIMGPNFRYCYKEYFDCADHTLALTHLGAAEHLYAAGFEVEAVVARFLPFSFRGVLPPSARLTRQYLRLPLLWPVLGRQFFLIGRRV
jgi:hypothetical protein